ncbi:hypothetical protein EXS54_01475 [Patescibacteria group bacterium]|nr:hypothetical protein [Patescibacteria group bacterium]
MANNTAKTYALALRNAGGDARKTWESLRETNQALATVPRLKQLLVGIGTRPAKVRKQEISKLFKGQPAQIQRLLDLLATDASVDQMPDILEGFTLLLRQEGFESVSIETARPLSSANISAILKSLNVDRRKILLEVVEEPSLIGGVRVTVGDRSYDMSIGGALDQLATNLEVRA